MSYKKGDIQIGKTFDLREDSKLKRSIHLPHSCEEWVIGGVNEAELMILDLQDAIRHFND